MCRDTFGNADRRPLVLVLACLLSAVYGVHLPPCAAAAEAHSTKIPGGALSVGLSADEDWISYETDSEGDGPWNRLRVVSWSGKRSLDLGHIDGADLQPNFCWASRGAEIAWLVTDEKTQKSKISFRNAKSGTTRTVPSLDDVSWPSFSPTNSTIAVTGVERGCFNPDSFDTELQRVFVLSSADGKIKHRGGGAGLPRQGPSVWSPDGSRVAYCDLNRVEYGPVNTWDLASGREYAAADVPLDDENINIYGTWTACWLDSTTVAWSSPNGVYVANYKQPSKCVVLTEGFLVDVLPLKSGHCKALLWNPRKDDRSKNSIFLVELKRQAAGKWDMHELGSMKSELFLDNGRAFPVAFARLSRLAPDTLIWLDKSSRLTKAKIKA